MALYKPMRGDSSRLEAQEFHDGYAYLTVNDGKLYFDAIDDNNNEKRILINPDQETTVSVEFMLTASGWVDGVQTVEIEGVTPSKDGFVYLSEYATAEQADAIAEADTDISQSEGALTFTCKGDVPTIDIPCYVVMGAIAGSDIFTEAAKQELVEAVLASFVNVSEEGQ